MLESKYAQNKRADCSYLRRTRKWKWGVCPTLTGDHQNRITDYTAIVVERTDENIHGDLAIGTSVVRRLTPTECGRLQGFPDGWVDIGDWTDTKGKTHKEADTPKYKAFGNSIAVGFQNNRSGFWCWLMRRISAQYEYRPTQGSLFSGIAGFDLAWAAVNGPESCRWSSEIEEFPIAVIKKHFGDEDAGTEGDFYQAIKGG